MKPRGLRARLTQAFQGKTSKQKPPFIAADHDIGPLSDDEILKGIQIVWENTQGVGTILVLSPENRRAVVKTLKTKGANHVFGGTATGGNGHQPAKSWRRDQFNLDGNIVNVVSPT